MAQHKTPIGTISAEVQKALNGYRNELAESINDAVEDIADEAVRTLREISPGPKKRGSFSQSWTRTKPDKQPGKIGIANVTIYNGKKYRLTHLIESGTRERVQKKTGRRTGKMPAYHIVETTEDKIEALLDKRLGRL